MSNHDTKKTNQLLRLLLAILVFGAVSADAVAIQDVDKFQHGDFGEQLCADVFETVGVPADQLGLGLPFHWCVHFATPMPSGVSKWYTLTNSVDLVNGPATGNALIANSGANFVDIVGSPGFGAINQNIETEAGRSYIVDFYVSSNQENGNTDPRLFNYFWNGVAELVGTEAPSQNTYDRFTFIHEATQNVTQVGWGAVNTPGSLDNNGVPFFGVLLDTVSAIEIRPNDDVTTLDENFPFSSFRLDVLENDSGIDRVVGAAVVGCSPNLTIPQCGSIIPDGFPEGQVFWDAPGGAPLAYDFLAEGEIATISIDYATETSRFEGREGDSANETVTVNTTGRWTITISGTNDPPVATPDDITVGEDDSVTFNLFTNDIDVDGTISLELLSQPSNGILLNNGGGNFEYTPTRDFCGSDAFFYRVEDDNGALSEIVTVSIEIVPDPNESADTFQRFRGVLVGGDIDDVQSTDDSFLTHRPGFTLNSEESPIWLEFDGSLSKASPSQLSFAIETGATTPNISQILELFNFDIGQFEVIDTRNATTNDSVTTVAATGDLNRFVSGGNVRARTGWIQAGFILAFPWEIRIDQVFWIEN